MHRSWDTLHAIKSMSIDKRNYLLHVKIKNKKVWFLKNRDYKSYDELPVIIPDD